MGLPVARSGLHQTAFGNRPEYQTPLQTARSSDCAAFGAERADDKIKFASGVLSTTPGGHCDDSGEKYQRLASDIWQAEAPGSAALLMRE